MSKRAPENTATADPLLFLLDAIARGPEGCVERQEARGQSDFVKSDTLPTEGLDHPSFAAMGIVVGDRVPGDDLFTFVTLPVGWKKQATDHAMHNALVDDKGRKRAAIFYKAAFYDRRADVRPECRYSAGRDYGDPFDRSKVVYRVLDGDSEVYRTDVHTSPTAKENPSRDDWNAADDLDKQLRAECLKWLADRGVTDPGNPALYWE